eukprot:ANDGO_07701.mRNA.1 putative WD repeat-containing protein K04G11.4
MDDDRIVAIVAQFLEERGFKETLASLTVEYGQEPNAELVSRGSELIARLTSDYDRELAAELEGLSVDGGMGFSANARSDASKSMSFAELDARPSSAPVSTLRYCMKDYHKGNMLCVKFMESGGQDLVLTGGADKQVCIVDYENSSVRSSLNGFQSAVLEVDLHPVQKKKMLAAEMAGFFSTFDLETGTRLFAEKYSIKYINRCVFSPDGKYFAVGSYDHTVAVYSAEDMSNPARIRDFKFPSTVESMVFTPDSRTLIAAVRDDCYLSYIQMATMTIDKVNMNANGDEHCSFNIMDLVVHPEGKYLLSCTDRSRLIMTTTDRALHARNFYGCVNDEYSMPRCAFDPKKEYVYASSQDRKVYVWDVFNQSVVQKLDHDGEIVRDIDLHPSGNLLATVGFGKTLRIFHRA